MTEEHSEIVLREARTTQPGTGDDPNEAPPTQRGVGLTVHDKSLRPSVLRWKSWQVSDSFREYAERAARGEKLPRFEGSILADPSRMLPMPSPDQSETSRRRAYGIEPPRPSLMNPDSLFWNPWLWAASATVFALGLFSFTLWYTTPRDEVVWETNALTPAPVVQRAAARPAREPRVAASKVGTSDVGTSDLGAIDGARSDLAASKSVDTSSTVRAPEPALAPAPPAFRPAPAASAAPPVAARPVTPPPPLAAATAPVLRAEPVPSAVAPLAKAAPMDHDTALDGLVEKSVGLDTTPTRTSSPAMATYPIPVEPLPSAAPTAPAPAASAVEEPDPLLVEAPSF